MGSILVQKWKMVHRNKENNEIKWNRKQSVGESLIEEFDSEIVKEIKVEIYKDFGVR